MYQKITTLKKSNNDELSDLTKRGYDNKYKNCIKNGITYDATEADTINKLNVILQKGEKINNVLSFINVVLVLRRQDGMTIENLLKYRKMVQTEANTQMSDVNKRTLEKDTLDKLATTSKDLVDYTVMLSKGKNYRAFIVNFLLIRCNVRNMDLDAYITIKQPNDETKNHIYLTGIGKRVEYHRNVYKTSNIYGKKKHNFEDMLFYDACLKLLDGKDTVKLLKAKSKIINGKEKSGNIGEEIIRMTKDRLGEGGYFKIMLRNASFTEVEKRGLSRGTNINAISQYYNLDKFKQ